LAGQFIEQKPNQFWCSIRSDFVWIFWFSPMVATFIWNSVFYAIIYYKFRQIKKLRALTQSHKKLETQLVKKISLFLLVFLLCWIWDIIDHILTAIKPACELYWLWILQDFFSPLQGFLNFLVYTLGYQDCCSKEEPVEKQNFMQNEGGASGI